MEPARLNIPQDAISALKAGHKVQAIKLIRQASGISLKDAVNLMDIYLSNNPDIQSAFLQNRGTSNLYATIAMIVGVILVVVAIAGKLFTGFFA